MTPKVIAMAGKGGTGKTTTSALLIKYLLEKKLTPVLAVDADSNSASHHADLWVRQDRLAAFCLGLSAGIVTAWHGIRVRYRELISILNSEFSILSGRNV